MRISRLHPLTASLALLLGLAAAPTMFGQSLVGSWQIVAEESDDMDPWRNWTVEIGIERDSLTMVRHWQAGHYYQHDSLRVSLDGTINTVPIRPGKWMNHVYLGVFVPDDATRDVTATWAEESGLLTIISVVPLETSQSDTKVRIADTYRVDPSENRLHLTEERSSRTTGPLHYIFERQ